MFNWLQLLVVCFWSVLNHRSECYKNIRSAENIVFGYEKMGHPETELHGGAGIGRALASAGKAAGRAAAKAGRAAAKAGKSVAKN